MAVACRLSELSLAGCYVTTNSPFPKSTRVILSLRANNAEAKVSGIVRIVHPEHGMGIEFVQSTVEQRNHVRRMIDDPTALEANLQSFRLNRRDWNPLPGCYSGFSPRRRRFPRFLVQPEVATSGRSLHAADATTAPGAGSPLASPERSRARGVRPTPEASTSTDTTKTPAGSTM